MIDRNGLRKRIEKSRNKANHYDGQKVPIKKKNMRLNIFHIFNMYLSIYSYYIYIFIYVIIVNISKIFKKGPRLYILYHLV